jgi:NTP pyrophosphatase (non-canonical NTP hydrolase)
MTMNKWTPETNPMILRRVGKTGEEAAELSKVCSRIVIQGIDGSDPRTDKTNISALTEEIADVIAQCEVCIESLGLDTEFIAGRVFYKKARMAEWESMFQPEPPKYEVGDFAILVRFGNESVMEITEVSINHGGTGKHRYYGKDKAGAIAAYEDELRGEVK